jgi:hypothetical protein
MGRHDGLIVVEGQLESGDNEHPVRSPRARRLALDVDEVGKLEGTPVFESRTMTAVFAPR